MIFLTVGTHEPFDRLVHYVDDWCAERHCGNEVFGQITARASYRPSHFRAVPSLDPVEYRNRFDEADFIVSHAGMGSIITALSMRKPIIVLPRRGHLQETRNDHQFATVKRFRSREGIFAVEDKAELIQMLHRIVDGHVTTGQAISPFADEQLIATLRDLIHGPDRDG